MQNRYIFFNLLEWKLTPYESTLLEYIGFKIKIDLRVQNKQLNFVVTKYLISIDQVLHYF